jgi:heat shock protein HtpX
MNTIKTGGLMIVLTVLLIVAGMAIGTATGQPFVPTVTIAFIFALVLNFLAYWFSDKIVLAVTGAREVSQKQEPELHRLVDEQATLARIPKPRVYIVESDSPNAFVTGRSPKHAMLAATRGITRLLNREELRGVIAHEMAHIKNRDTLIMTVAAAIAGAIAYLGTMAQWFMIFGGRRSANPAGLIGLLVVAIVLPLAAMLIRLAVSRAREFQADTTGARISGTPWALADALEKLEAGARRRPLKVNEGVAHLFIVNPLSGQAVASLFSTHPPISERVNRLRQMKSF